MRLCVHEGGLFIFSGVAVFVCVSCYSVVLWKSLRGLEEKLDYVSNSMYKLLFSSIMEELMRLRGEA
jgi:hypothetical protein